MNARPLYLDAGNVPVFGLIHDANDRGPLAALIVPPWGWEEVASYRARRQWADMLAMRGVTTLRLDLPGTGDSGGDACDGDQVGSWVTAIDSAAAWLAALPGVESVVAIGLGAGGLLTLAALDAGAPIDELIVWAAPADGRRLARTLRAFAGTQASRPSDAESDTAPPDGWMDVNGFPLHPETLASLRALDARSLATGAVRRALVIAQDGLSDGDSIASRLEQHGVAVSLSGAKGWADLVAHPEQSVLAPAIVHEVDRWLMLCEADSNSTTPPCPVPAPDRCRLDELEGAIVETALRFDSPEGELFAIASEPAGSDHQPGLGLVFLNPGAVRRIGPNRLWVTAARRWASRGVPSLRVDLGGVGDGFGTNTCPAGVEDLYDPSRLAQVQRAIDLASRRWPACDILLVGLCSGGYWAFRGAQSDPRVRGAVLLNAGALEWHADTSARHQAARLRKIGDAAEWRRLKTGNARRRAARSALRALVGALRWISTRFTERIRGTAFPPESAELGFELLDRRGTSVVLAFSGDELLERELTRSGLIERLAQWTHVEQRRLPGIDHTLRPLAARRAALDLLDEVIQRLDTPRLVRPPNDENRVKYGRVEPVRGVRDVDKNRDVFDRVAESYTDRALAPAERMLLARLSPMLHGMDMLELGVGTGRTAYTFAPLVRRYVGLDYAPAMLAGAEALLADDTNVELVLGDARDLSCVRGPFDVVTFSFNGIDAVSYQDRRRVLEQVASVLRPGGWFMFSSHSTRALPLATKKSRSPIRMRSRAYRWYARVDDVRYWWKVRRINTKQQLGQARTRAWTTVTSFGHNFRLDDCYVDPAHQVSVLEQLGFQEIELFDREGRPVTAADPGDGPWLHYLCRSPVEERRGSPRL